MPIGPAVVRDFFARSASNGWTAPNSGQNWRSALGTIGIGNSNYSIQNNTTSHGGYINVNSGTTTNFHSEVYVDGGVTDTENGVLVKVQVSSVVSEFGVILRRASTNSFYIARVNPNQGWVSIIVKDSNIALPHLVQLGGASMSLSANTWYWLRFRNDHAASQMRFKVWAEGAAEPASWTVSTAYYNGAQTPGAGNCGFWHRGQSNAYTIRIDSFYGYQNFPDIQPDLPINVTFSPQANRGWGQSTNHHMWNGALADDPDRYAALSSTPQLWTTGTNAWLRSEGTGARYGYFNVTSTDVDVSAQIMFGGNTNDVMAGVCSRLTMTFSGGVENTGGYILYVTRGTTSITLQRTSVGGSTITLASSSSLGFTANNGVVFNIKLQTVGTQIRGKAWEDGTSEPSWQVNATDSLHPSGFPGMIVSATTTAGRNFTFNEFSVQGAQGGVTQEGAANLSAQTTLSAAGVREKRGAANLSSQSSLTVNSEVVKGSGALLVAQTNLHVAPLSLDRVGAATIQAQTTLNVTGKREVEGQATLSAQTVLTADSDVHSPPERRALVSWSEVEVPEIFGEEVEGEVDLHSQTNLFIDVSGDIIAFANLEAQTSMIAQAGVTRPASATISAKGTLQASGGRIRVSSSDLHAQSSVLVSVEDFEDLFGDVLRARIDTINRSVSRRFVDRWFTAFRHVDAGQPESTTVFVVADDARNLLAYGFATTLWFEGNTLISYLPNVLDVTDEQYQQWPELAPRDRYEE